MNGESCVSLPMVARINDREFALGRFDTLRGWQNGNAAPIVPLWSPPDPQRLAAWQAHAGPLAASLLRVIGPAA
jgi:hypothetical protein